MSKLLPIIEYFIDNQLYWDFLVKWVISLLMIVKVVRDLIVYNLSELQTKKNEFINHVNNSDIADHEKEVNDLHYEMSVDIMKLMLGPLLKHSACYFPTGKETLKEAEIEMLELYCKRAECFDGMKCLDVGCGWGSLAFYLAKKYPKSTITCFTNSKAQVFHIEKVCEDENITNVITVLGDLNNPPKDFINKFDRIIAVELLEHLKNYKLCFNTFYKWLDYDGKLFIQSFGYRLYPSHFEFDQNQRASNWLAKYFCKGATMVSLDIYLYFQDKLKLENCWIEKGTHYANSFKHWIKQIDSNKKELQNALSEYYGDKQEGFYWFSRWRFFLLVSSIPFRLFGGNFWGVGHYLFKKPSALQPSTSSLYSID